SVCSFVWRNNANPIHGPPVLSGDWARFTGNGSGAVLYNKSRAKRACREVKRSNAELSESCSQMSALCQKQTSELFDIISGHCRIPHREPHVLLIVGVVPILAAGSWSNCCLRHASAEHDEQQRGSHDIDHPYDRRRQARESTNDIGYTRDDEGDRKSRYREFKGLRAGHLG